MRDRDLASLALNAAVAIGPVLAVLLCWELAAHYGGASALFPPLEDIFAALVRMAKDGDLARDVLGSLRRLFESVVLGALIGTFAGEKAARRMKAQGLDIDLAKINSDLSQMNGPEFDEFLRSLNDTNIEIDDGKAQVRITAE